MINLNWLMDRILYQIFKKFFGHLLKRHGESVGKPSVQIYVYKIENRTTFKIKNEYSLELVTPETMKFLGSTENKITKDRNIQNARHLEVTEVVLVHCDIVNNNSQQDSRVLDTFVPNKLFSSLLEIYPINHIFLKSFNSEYDEIKVWFTNQNSQPLEVEDRINLGMVIKRRLYV